MSYKIHKQYRKPGFDYTLNNGYFITICTKDRIHYFGKIKDCEMILSPVGEVVKNEWLKTPKIRKNVILDNWVIMPNHFHGIIIIQDPNQSAFHDCIDFNHKNFDIPHNLENGNRRNAPWRVLNDNTNFVSQQNTPRRVPTGIQPLVKGSISSIINHFKGNVKRYCNKNGFEYFTWQPRFHDRIIRDQEELHNIQNYIYYNPANWYKDRNNLGNLLM